MKYYLIAGEASGDLHGSNLVKALQQKDHSGQYRAWGGNLMQVAGCQVVKHYRDLAFMGFWEVITNLRTILRNLSFCKKDILEFKPDVLILIDYPGFNLRIAKWAKAQGIRVVYYISPQIWAWKENRVHGIKKSVDQLLVILPFEQNFYKKHDFHADFVGHPLLDVVATYSSSASFQKKHGLKDKKIIALLPGSRKQEINKMLSIMLQMPSYFPDYQFVIAGAPSQDRAFYEQIIQQKKTDKQSDITIIENETYDLLHHSTAALVTSGTATLETALFGVPQVVCYKASPISYAIAKRLVKIKYISLVNLIMDKEIVRELIQHDLNEEELQSELTKLLASPHRENMQKAYEKLREKLGNAGASERAAELIFNKL